MYLPSPGHGVGAVVASRKLPLPAPEAAILPLRPPGKASFKFLSFRGAEFVTAAEDVGSVCVVGRVEGREQVEHFGGVTAAA